MSSIALPCLPSKTHDHQEVRPVAPRGCDYSGVPAWEAGTVRLPKHLEVKW